MFKLVIQDDEGKTTVVPLIRDEITIGRKEGNTIRLTERNVSRRHARIVRANGAVAIEDLGSYNGVRVNGTRIAQRTSLTVSDRVQIGDYLIELKAEGVEQSADDSKTQPIERMDAVEAQLAATMPPQPGAAPMVALADTDPSARPVAAAVPVPVGQTSGHARVVVLSSNFAGQEWELSRAQMIIGRTDDNDVVINHRSISRNHAKVVREPDTGRYTISDLQSSNGVKVNGEEYGKVELRRGDVIDLGHVRLRFVEPGEDFVFGRDAHISDIPTGGKGRGVMIAAGLALIGVAVVAVVMLTRGGDKTKSKPDHAMVASGSAEASGSQTAIAPPVLPDAAAPMVATTDAAPTSDVGTQLAECRAKRDGEDWGGTIDCAKKMLEKSPNNTDANDLVDQAKREQANELLLDDLKAAAGRKDFQETIRLYKKIGPDSIYAKRAGEVHDKLRQDFVSDEVTKAKQQAARHLCKDKDKRAAQIGKIWSEAKTALDAIPCETKTIASGDNGGSGARPDPECRSDDDCGSGKTCKTGACVTAQTTAGANCDANQLLDDARAAGSVNQWSKVLQKAEASNKCEGSRTARQLALLAACRLGQKDKAMKYWKEFENNAMSKQQCIGVVP